MANLSKIFDQSCGGATRPALVQAIGNAFGLKEPARAFQITSILVEEHTPDITLLPTPVKVLAGAAGASGIEAADAFHSLLRACGTISEEMKKEHPRPHEPAARTVDALILAKSKALQAVNHSSASYCEVGRPIIEELEIMLYGAAAFEGERGGDVDG